VGRGYFEGYRAGRFAVSDDRLVGMLVLAVLAGTAVLAGCGSSSSPSSELRHRPAKPSCTRAGLRYVGTTDQHTTVCFTITANAKQLVEIGFEFPLGCSLDGSMQYEGALPALAPTGASAKRFRSPLKEMWRPHSCFAGGSEALPPRAVCPASALTATRTNPHGPHAASPEIEHCRSGRICRRGCVSDRVFRR
jgi:hypothetical protein